MLNNRSYAEKRDFIRMAVDCPVQYTLLGETEVYWGTARDLSGGGLLLETDTAWPLGTVLWLKLVPGAARIPPLEAEGEVVRVDPREGGFNLGISITGVKR